MNGMKITRIFLIFMLPLLTTTKIILTIVYAWRATACFHNSWSWLIITCIPSWLPTAIPHTMEQSITCSFSIAWSITLILTMKNGEFESQCLDGWIFHISTAALMVSGMKKRNSKYSCVKKDCYSHVYRIFVLLCTTR